MAEEDGESARQESPGPQAREVPMTSSISNGPGLPLGTPDVSEISQSSTQHVVHEISSDDDSVYIRPWKRRRTQDFDDNSDDSDSLFQDNEPTNKEMIRQSLPPTTKINKDVQKGERKLIETALKKFGLPCDELHVNQGRFKLPFLVTKLTPIQMATAGFMIGRERSRTDLLNLGGGGIIAHEMGIGKTLIAIATIVGNDSNMSLTIMEKRAAEKGPKQTTTRQTLIICPNSATIRHWQSEITKHAKDFFSGDDIYRYKYGHLDAKPDIIKKYRIVITTYRDLLSGPSDSDLENDTSERPNALFEYDWFRVILDEAHEIKNINTKRAKAVFKINARHGWVITGTPLSNSPNELLPYFKFLKVSHSDSLRQFESKYFIGGKPSRQLESLISKIKMQRTKDDTFLGKTLLKLPDLIEDTMHVDLLPHEKTLYEIFLSRTKRSLSLLRRKQPAGIKKEDEGEVESDDKQVVFRILKLLIMAATHPFLLEASLAKKFGADKLENLQEIMERKGDVPRTTLSPLPPPSMARLLHFLREEIILDGAVCVNGRKNCVPITDDMSVFPCGNNVCKVCTKKRNPGEVFCKHCQKPHALADIGDRTTLESAQDAPNQDDDAEDMSEQDESSDPSPVPSPAARKAKGKGRPRRPKMPGDDFDDWQPYLREARGEGFLKYTNNHIKTRSILPSAKLVAAMKIIRTWRREAPEDKIIVFTQNIKIGQLLGRLVEIEKIKFLYYFGDQSDARKKKSYDLFRDEDDIKILISSLKCGGQALDITSANRVILMEPWWNRPVEKQAIGRIHRMGQTKKCYAVRIIANNTFEDRMCQVQAEKEEIVRDCLLQDRLLPGLTMDSLYKFIGAPRKGKDGNMEFHLDLDEDDEYGRVFGDWGDVPGDVVNVGTLSGV